VRFDPEIRGVLSLKMPKGIRAYRAGVPMGQCSGMPGVFAQQILLSFVSRHFRIDNADFSFYLNKQEK